MVSPRFLVETGFRLIPENQLLDLYNAIVDQCKAKAKQLVTPRASKKVMFPQEANEVQQELLADLSPNQKKKLKKGRRRTVGITTGVEREFLNSMSSESLLLPQVAKSEAQPSSLTEVASEEPVESNPEPKSDPVEPKSEPIVEPVEPKSSQQQGVVVPDEGKSEVAPKEPVSDAKEDAAGEPPPKEFIAEALFS